MRPNERSVYLHRLADLIDRDLDTLADLEAMDCGKLRAAAAGDIKWARDVFRYYADLAIHAHYKTPLPVPGFEARTVLQPFGVCAFIFPWNFPFVLLGLNIPPALAAGNTAVIKPAADTPLSTLYLMNLVEEAGIPAGVVNVVAGYGDKTGMALAKHPMLKRLSLTGSPEVGKIVTSACGANLVPVKMELGGKGAAVVFTDVDIEFVAQKLTEAITFHSGQVCCDATRWLIQDKIYDKFISTVSAKLEAVRVGYGFDSQTQMGPVVNEKQRQRILGYIKRGQEEGAKALVPGGVCKVAGYDGGFYVRPTLLAGSLDNVAAREEIFGPVAFATRFRNEAEAVKMANDTNYGLANSVWSKDLVRCNRVAELMVSGNSWINAHNVFPIGVPYAGINLSGLGGGVLSPQTFFDYLRGLSVVRPW
jgi:aldehyde dehydrogenase (NAD+)